MEHTCSLREMILKTSMKKSFIIILSFSLFFSGNLVFAELSPYYFEDLNNSADNIVTGKIVSAEVFGKAYYEHCFGLNIQPAYLRIEVNNIQRSKNDIKKGDILIVSTIVVEKSFFEGTLCTGGSSKAINIDILNKEAKNFEYLFYLNKKEYSEYYIFPAGHISLQQKKQLDSKTEYKDIKIDSMYLYITLFFKEIFKKIVSFF